MRTETFDIKKACEAQGKFVNERDYPYFAPMDGRCYKCGHNIYAKIQHGDYFTGYSVETASSLLITGCPHCNISYCE